MEIIMKAIILIAIFGEIALVFLYTSMAEIPKEYAKHFNILFIVETISIMVALLAGLLYINNNSNKIETNTDLPKDMYYLGVEIVDSWIDSGKYYYEFGCPDSMGMPHDGISYWWESTSPLYIDYPYMLTMDSMGTASVKDDEIICVWRLIE